jgi:hypothetical protein
MPSHSLVCRPSLGGRFVGVLLLVAVPRSSVGASGWMRSAVAFAWPISAHWHLVARETEMRNIQEIMLLGLIIRPWKQGGAERG